MGANFLLPVSASYLDLVDPNHFLFSYLILVPYLVLGQPVTTQAISHQMVGTVFHVQTTTPTRRSFFIFEPSQNINQTTWDLNRELARLRTLRFQASQHCGYLCTRRMTHLSEAR